MFVLSTETKDEIRGTIIVGETKESVLHDLKLWLDDESIADLDELKAPVELLNYDSKVPLGEIKKSEDKLTLESYF